MFYSNYNVSSSYKECLVNDIQIYSENNGVYNSCMEFGILKTAIEMSNPRDEVYEKFKSLRNYKKYINNETSARNLKTLDPSEVKGFDNYANRIYDKKISIIDETEKENIKSGKTLLRLNDKNQVIYTVSKVGDRFAFKNFSLIEGNLGPGYSVKLFLNSIWYVKQLPDIKNFDNILPLVSSIDDVINADPNFRCCEKNGILYSTHFFADEKGHTITIEYFKNSKGIYKVKNITRAAEGFNLLPCLLPIDKELLSSNSFAGTENQSEKYIPGNFFCNIM